MNALNVLKKDHGIIMAFQWRPTMFSNDRMRMNYNKALTMIIESFDGIGYVMDGATIYYDQSKGEFTLYHLETNEKTTFVKDDWVVYVHNSQALFKLDHETFNKKFVVV